VSATSAGLPASAAQGPQPAANAPAAGGPQRVVTPPSPQAAAQAPLRFEVNEGQPDPRVAFLARGSGYTLFLTHVRQAALDLHAQHGGDVLRMDLIGSNPAPQAVPLDELSGKSNYFVGSDPARWQTGVSSYGRVEFRDVYPGIDLDYYGAPEGKLEYDFVVHPGADPSRIRLNVAGAESVRLDGRGGLAVHTAAGDLDEAAPALYQPDGATRQPVTGGFRLGPGRRITFQVGAYDPSRPLVIDPAVAYSTAWAAARPSRATPWPSTAWATPTSPA
jgi:hypothetical protein